MEIPKSVKFGFRLVPSPPASSPTRPNMVATTFTKTASKSTGPLAPNMRTMVLVHEVLHAMFATAMPQVDDETEETVIRALMPQIVG